MIRSKPRHGVIVSETLQYRIADVDIAIEAPAEILSIIVESYRRFPRTKNRTHPHATVRASLSDDGQLSLTNGEMEYKRLSAAAGHGLIGLELSNAIITAVAAHSRFLILHAAALEHEGQTLCIAAKGHTGKTLLAAHLLSRGWRVLSDEYAFIEPASGHVVPFPKLLYVRSSSLPHLPRSFRKSVESSPWYGMGDSPGLVFSGVDPADSYSEAIWSQGARLSRLLVMIDRMASGPTIMPCKPWSLIPDLNGLAWQPADLLDGLSKIAAALRGVEVARIVTGDPIRTVNAIERWALSGGQVLLHA